jgi:hypothetical protein
MSSTLPNPDPGFNVIVSKEEFNLFYSVDRKLFTRLLKTIGRDSSQAINLMAFFMWLERKGKDMNLVQKLLNNWSDIMLINLCNESAIVLDYMEFSRFPLNFSPDEKHFLPSIQHILRVDDHLTLNFFYDRRLEIITEVTKLVNDICKRAFSDIIEKVNQVDDVIDVDFYLDNVFGASDRVHFPPPPPRLRMQPPMAYFDPNVVPMVVPAPKFNEFGENDAYNGHQNINQIMANLSLDDIYAADTGFVTSTDNEKKIEMRPIDDRTLFITFSKCYPISENELREYFTRYVPFNHFIYLFAFILYIQSNCLIILCSFLFVLDFCTYVNAQL